MISSLQNEQRLLFILCLDFLIAILSDIDCVKNGRFVEGGLGGSINTSSVLLSPGLRSEYRFILSHIDSNEFLCCRIMTCLSSTKTRFDVLLLQHLYLFLRCCIICGILTTYQLCHTELLTKPNFYCISKTSVNLICVLPCLSLINCTSCSFLFRAINAQFHTQQKKNL